MVAADQDRVIESCQRFRHNDAQSGQTGIDQEIAIRPRVQRSDAIAAGNACRPAKVR